MEAGWVKAFTADKLYKADIAVELLAENDIPAVAINKQESSLQIFGNAEVYVKDEDLERAKEIFKTTSL